MTLHNGCDAAFPGAALPAGTGILCAYVGGQFQPGAPDTPHIWTGAEWNEYIEKQPALRLLPIYVHDYPGPPEIDADNAVDAVRALGWALMPGALRRVIAFDTEMLQDPSYVQAVENRMNARGFSCMPYGSNNYVKSNPASFGYWVADYVAHAPKTLGIGVQGCQWHAGTLWDYSVFSDAVYQACAAGLRAA